MYLLSIKETIDSAHKLTDYVGKCNNLHGHRWDIEIGLKFKDNEIQKNNILIDFKEVKSKLKEYLDRYDHKYLNEVLDEKNVTAEYLSKRMYDELKVILPALFYITIFETEKNGLTYREDSNG